MEDKIKELVELTEQLNKLGLKALELLGILQTATLIALSIKSLIEMI